MSVDTKCPMCETYFPTGDGSAKMCRPCYIKRVGALEDAIRKHGRHPYDCASVGASLEDALFRHLPVPACNCWMSILNSGSPQSGAKEKISVHGAPVDFESQMKEFREKLTDLLNSVSMENRSNTPDFILSELLAGCLDAFDKATNARTAWYGQK